MPSKKMRENQPDRNVTPLSPSARVAIALVGPIAVALLISVLAGGLPAAETGDNQFNPALSLAGAGMAGWFLGLRWYGLPEMGLRGRRPLFAGIGFAALGWVAFLLFRFFFVPVTGIGPAGSGRTFVYLFLFEAFAVQLWLFGLLFRSLADWRGPLSATIGSGMVFGVTVFLLFQESFTSNVSSFLYFLLWGVLYGVIRLRTGSILGPIMVQTMQSFTAWVVMTPQPQPDVAQLQSLYLFTSLAYLVIIWRLWPKRESDYRI